MSLGIFKNLQRTCEHVFLQRSTCRKADSEAAESPHVADTVATPVVLPDVVWVVACGPLMVPPVIDGGDVTWLLDTAKLL